MTDKNINFTQSFNDSNIYKTAKHKKKDAGEILTKIKTERETRNLNHIEFIKSKNQYLEKDSQEYPGFIFCHESIIKKYNINSNYLKNNLLPVDKIPQRKIFLENSIDKGEYYFSFKERLISRTLLQEYLDKKEANIAFFNNSIKDLLTEEQYSTFNFCVDQMNNAKKRKFIVKKALINLESQTDINISHFFSVNWNCADLHVQKKNTSSKLLFNDKIEELTQLNKKIEEENSFVNTTLNKLKKNVISILDNYSLEYLEYKQDTDDEYIVKWSVLNEEQRINRFKSFVNFFVINKLFIPILQPLLSKQKLEAENLIDPLNFIYENENDLINKLYTVISENYLKNNLKYRQIKWNDKKGVIEFIYNLKWTPSFIPIDTTNIQVILDISFDFVPAKQIKRKATSSRSLTALKVNVENINEFILHFIIHFLKDENINIEDKESIQNLQKKKAELCIESLKPKMKVNRFTNKDKNFIINQYNEFFQIIFDEMFVE